MSLQLKMRLALLAQVLCFVLPVSVAMWQGYALLDGIIHNRMWLLRECQVLMVVAVLIMATITSMATGSMLVSSIRLGRRSVQGGVA